MKMRLLAFAAVLAVPVTVLSAQPAPGPIQDRMDGTDQRSLVHTRGELTGHIRTMFARLDVNRDGFLTQAEVQAGRPVRGDRLIRRDPAQANANNARAFDRFDVNRDGAISRSEWDARAVQRHQRGLARAGNRDLKAHRMGSGRGFGIGGHMFEIADVNRDNRVSFAEAQNAALQHFDRIDLNRDGAVTPDERRHNRQLRRSQPPRS